MLNRASAEETRPGRPKPKKTKKSEEKTFFCAAILDNFQTKMFISETTSFHYFSPRIPNIGYPTSGSGGKKTVKKDRKPKKIKKSEKSGDKKLFLCRDFRQFSNKNAHI